MRIFNAGSQDYFYTTDFVYLTDLRNQGKLLISPSSVPNKLWYYQSVIFLIQNLYCSVVLTPSTKRSTSVLIFDSIYITVVPNYTSSCPAKQ
jgi:hypothetical protein